MATATEIATRALKRITVVAAGETPSAAEMSDAKDALNAMIASWAAEGLTGDTLPLDSKFEQGIIALLAVRLAEDYGKSPGPVLVNDANKGWAQLQAEFIQTGEPQFDYALIRTPSRRFPYTVPIDGTIPWKANTWFGLGVLVTNAGNVYVCIQAGISDTAGPSRAGMNQIDGSCIWDYVEAIGV